MVIPNASPSDRRYPPVALDPTANFAIASDTTDLVIAYELLDFWQKSVFVT
jgi:hypothetical protein